MSWPGSALLVYAWQSICSCFIWGFEMITLRQAVELTLSAIEEGVSFDHLDNVTAPMLRRALAEPNKCTHGVTDGNCKECYMAESEQEPVAWMTHSNDLLPLFHRTEHAALMWGAEPTPLYTAPPQRKPLTDEEIWQIVTNCTIGSDLHADKLARAIEQAHGIKGDA